METKHEPENRAVRAVPLSRRIMGAPPAKTLDDAVRLCDPNTPLDPIADTTLRSDLDAIRGGDGLSTIALNIRRSGGTPTLHFLTGHAGSGKTTELLRMKQSLCYAEGSAPENTVVYFDANILLDRFDVDLEDIVVALWSVVFQQAPNAALEVLASLWQRQIRNTVASFVVNMPDKVPDAVGAVLGQLKLPGWEQRQKLRVAVGNVLNALIDGLNLAFAKIKEDAAGSVVVLIDNLEKVEQGQRASVERLYLDRMGALKELDAHLVIAVPLFLCYSASGASLVRRYGGEIVVLPMVKVRKPQEQGGGDDLEGLAAMGDVLRRRLDFGVLFEDGVAAALDIARYSGGCIRDALRMVQGAANRHRVPPVTAASIARVAATIEADYERALPEAWVPVLRAVAEHNRFPDACPEDTKRELLRHLFVLEYQNGGPRPWYGVHPLVERCCKYREHGR